MQLSSSGRFINKMKETSEQRCCCCCCCCQNKTVLSSIWSRQAYFQRLIYWTQSSKRLMIVTCGPTPARPLSFSKSWAFPSIFLHFVLEVTVFFPGTVSIFWRQSTRKTSQSSNIDNIEHDVECVHFYGSMKRLRRLYRDTLWQRDLV